MRLLALVSGGKDSILSILLAQHVYGHEVVGLLNVRPKQDFAISHEHINGGDVDSHCFQTVGYQVLDGLAQCMNLPLFRASIGPNQSINQQLTYCEVQQQQQPSSSSSSLSPANDDDNASSVEKGDDGDEVEVLFQLVKSTCEKFAAQGRPVGGLCSGAILSNYQRLRVERICQRLKLASYAFLWQRPALNVLRLVKRFNVEAILVKIASFGLKPSFLGKSLMDMTPTLAKLHRAGMCHAAGEGGEFETVVLSCPKLFSSCKKKMVIRNPANSKVVGADVKCGSGEGTLVFDVDVVDDDNDDGDDDDKKHREREAQFREAVGSFDISGFCGYVSVEEAIRFLGQESSSVSPTVVVDALRKKRHQQREESQKLESIDCAFNFSIKNEATSSPEGDDEVDRDRQPNSIDIGEQAKRILVSNLENKDINNEESKSSIIYTLVQGSQFKYFADVNNAYLEVFAKTVPPPSRAFVGCGDDARLKISVISLKKKTNNHRTSEHQQHQQQQEAQQQVESLSRSTLHVQSISNWAAACIGPYAQSQTITCCCEVCSSSSSCSSSKIILTSGTIGLEPPTMVLAGSAPSSRYPCCIEQSACPSASSSSSSSSARMEEIQLFQESVMALANVHAILQKSGNNNSNQQQQQHGLDLVTHGTVFFARKRLSSLIVMKAAPAATSENNIDDDGREDSSESRPLIIFNSAWKYFAQAILKDTSAKVKRHDKIFNNESDVGDNEDDDDVDVVGDSSNTENNESIDECDRQTDVIKIPSSLIDSATGSFIHLDFRVVFVETLPRDAAVEFIAGVSFSRDDEDKDKDKNENEKTSSKCLNRLSDVAMAKFFAATAL